MVKKKRKEPKQRNYLVAHVMKKGVKRHKNKKRCDRMNPSKRLEE